MFKAEVPRLPLFSFTPTSLAVFCGEAHHHHARESLGVHTEEKEKKTRIAKTSKFFLFFPLSEKCSPPFPIA
jgi:hypothetical protein